MLMLLSFHLEEVQSLMLNNLSKKNLIFIILSSVYITFIFLLSDSSVALSISVFNPFSLLHIPLYGILTLLINLAIRPCSSKKNDTKISSLNKENRFDFYLWVPALIALVVAIFDEFYQFYIPERNASLTDIILDIIGIALVSLFFKKFNKPFENQLKFKS